ncbi:MAG: hydrolase [Syntrophomonadaceae bacterium]|jgi:nicotinamidase-related amidase|nr:hydrolase [Syntrophomonadaceae bacterium]
MLEMDKTALLIVDIQGVLARTVYEANLIYGNWQKLIKAAQLFQLPIVLMEQNPRGLGPTIPELRELLGDLPAIEKMTFNACLNEEFLKRLREIGREQILVAGVEAHVCVYQTVCGLLKEPYQIYVASDAVSSRTSWNRMRALERMRELGAVITTTEMALFEMMRTSEGELFRQFIKIVK